MCVQYESLCKKTKFFSWVGQDYAQPPHTGGKSCPTGKIIETFVLKDIKGSQIWDTRKYANGIYFYELKCDKQRLDTGKIIVEN